MSTATTPERWARRARLEEGEWAALAADSTAPLPDWAAPLPEVSPDPSPADALLGEALALRAAPALVVDVATSAGEIGLLAEVTTDLSGVVTLVRRLAVTPGAPDATRRLGGVEVGATGASHLAAEIVRLLPDAPDTGGRHEVEVPEELTVALGRAMRTGDATTVEAVCADQGWSEVPAVLHAVVHGLRGSAVVTVRSPGRGPLAAEWLLTETGWVELVLTDRATVRHVPRSRADIARTLTSALTRAASAALAQAGPR